MWKPILWLLKSIFIVNTFFAFTTYSQTVTPDTVIIERIKVERKEIYIHEVDTLVQIDTVIQIQKDTVYVEQEKENNLPSWDHGSQFFVGGHLGTSYDIQHTQYWKTEEEYYNKTREANVSKPNFNAGLHFGMMRKKLNYQVGVNWLSLRDQFSFDSFSQINSFHYLDLETQIGYSLLRKSRFELISWGKISVKHLIRQKGSYFEVSNSEIVTTDINVFPVNKNLFSIGARLSARYSLKDHWVGETSLNANYWPRSITQTEHPVLYWKTLFGLDIGISRFF